ncbi:zinc-binding dehydrogenase, partial [Frankia sp. CNm7]|uniref:zinc-binding dehydrogenase n=1 Tax=Frankia nepalensis TaxID=1836974 RepID=UPI001933419C
PGGARVPGRRAAAAAAAAGTAAGGAAGAVGARGAAGGGARAGDRRPLRPGDRVVWNMVVGCGRCDRCAAGRTAGCRAAAKIGHVAFDPAGPLALFGTFGTHVHLPRTAHVTRVPDDLPDEVAARGAGATATAGAARAAAVRASGRPLAGARVLVSGAGMLGLTAVAMAADAGAAEVVAVDVDRSRLRLATAFGASRTIVADGPTEAPGAGAHAADTHGANGDGVGGHGAAGHGAGGHGPDGPVPGRAGPVDVALDFSGAATAVAAALAALDGYGTLVLVGSVMPSPAVALDPERVVRGRLTITGVHNYEPADLDTAVAFLVRTHRAGLPWASLVARPIPLTGLAALLTGHSTGQPPRLAVRP